MSFQSNAQLHNQTQSIFLSLPRELRNQVYDEVWQYTPRLSVLNYPRRDAIVRAFSTAASFSGWYSGSTTLPPWVFACEQIYNEAAQQFALKGTWLMELGAVPCLWNLTSPFSPAGAFRLQLNMRPGLFTRSLPDGCVPCVENLPPLAEFLQYANEKRRALELVIWIKICYTVGVNGRMDFSRIEHAILPNDVLTTLSMSVNQVFLPIPGNAFQSSCAIAIKRLGTLVMGTVSEPLIEETSQQETIFTVHRLDTWH